MLTMYYNKTLSPTMTYVDVKTSFWITLRYAGINDE